MHRSRLVVCAAALAWIAALCSSDAATLSVKGGSGTGGGTIVRGGTGDASNTDASATGDTDTLAALGFSSLTLTQLTSDLEALELFVTVTNDSGFAADAALIQSLNVFFTAPSICSTDSLTDCAPISSIQEGFGGLKYDTGPNAGQPVNTTAEVVIAAAQLTTAPGTEIPFGTTQAFSLTNAQAASIAALLLAAYPQGDPTSPYSGDPNFLNLIYLGLSVQTIGVLFDGSTLSGYEEVTDSNGTRIFPSAPVDTQVTVPEPGSLTLLGIGLVSMVVRARRRRARKPQG